MGAFLKAASLSPEKPVVKVCTGGAVELSHKTAQSFTLSTQPVIFVHDTNGRRVSLSLYMTWHIQ